MLAEDALIDALRALVERPFPGRIHLGIGDDAAVWQPSRSHRSVITTDALVEDVHFTRAMASREIGWRAMASNISDIGAMGARPVLATIALGLPSSTERDAVLELYRGMVAVSDDAHCAIVGGDVTRAPVLTISITVVGEVRASNLKTRSGAKPADALVVTGPLGASRAGLHGSVEEEAISAHRLPQPRWREGVWLGASNNVHAMMDLSDGLSTDLARLCARSNVGAVIDDVPVASSARAMAIEREEDPIAYALAGGEDFELLAAVDARALTYLQQRFTKRFGRQLYRIGTVRKGTGLVVRKGATEEQLVPTGWDSLQ